MNTRTLVFRAGFFLALTLRLSAGTNVLVSAGALRDAAGNPLPSGALVALVASTADTTFSAPLPGVSIRPGETLANDDIVVATWAVDSASTGVVGGSYRLVSFDYAALAIPNFGAGDKLMLYWFPAATLVNPVILPNATYGGYRTDSISPHSNMNWVAPVDTNGATLALGFLTDGVGGDVAWTAGTAASAVASGTGAPVIAVQPINRTSVVGTSVTLSVTATGASPLTYQWFKGEQSIPTGTAANLTFASVSATDAGTYKVVVSNGAGSVTSANATLTVSSGADVAPGLLNVAARGHAGKGAMVLSGAFTVEGNASKQMLVRGVGPALSTFSVSGVLTDPRLEIVNATTGAVVASNDDWNQAANAAQLPAVSAQAGAFALAQGSKDAAILGTFPPGTYRARVLGASENTGVAQLEIFDADSTPRLVYLATRARIGSGNNVLVQGIAISAPVAGRSYLIRALGPALGITGALTDPQLAVYSGANGATPLASSDNWGGDAAIASVSAVVGAMPLPAGSKDAALNFVPPAAGIYTAQVSGVGAAAGIALLEVFEADAQRAATLPAAIVSPPESVAVSAGQPASIGVVSVGKPAPTYQWRKNSNAISGAAQSTFSITSTQTGDAGNYDVVVTNSGGTATSASVQLLVNATSNHSADSDGDFRFSLLELTRVIELFNTRNGTTRTGCYAVASTASEDGFVAEPGRALGGAVTLTKYHSADPDRNGNIDLFELTRVIAIYNYRSGTVRTGQYRVDLSSEDGFSPGP